MISTKLTNFCDIGDDGKKNNKRKSKNKVKERRKRKKRGTIRIKKKKRSTDLIETSISRGDTWYFRSTVTVRVSKLGKLGIRNPFRLCFLDTVRAEKITSEKEIPLATEFTRFRERLEEIDGTARNEIVEERLRA